MSRSLVAICGSERSQQQHAGLVIAARLHEGRANDGHRAFAAIGGNAETLSIVAEISAAHGPVDSDGLEPPTERRHQAACAGCYAARIGGSYNVSRATISHLPP